MDLFTSEGAEWAEFWAEMHQKLTTHQILGLKISQKFLPVGLSLHFSGSVRP